MTNQCKLFGDGPLMVRVHDALRLIESSASVADLAWLFSVPTEEVFAALRSLEAQGFVEQTGDVWRAIR